VLVTFAGLAGALLAAREAGIAAGWGFQFQSPVFVAVLAWLLFGIGLNLSGVYEIGHGLAGAGHGLAARGGHLGSFFTGLLAVVVATPCTAPFMGVAVAAALGAPAMIGVLIFLAMGLGLASPTLMLAALPGAARWAPRPGRWMVVLRQALAFPMYGASAWLVWVASQETGSGGVLAILAGLVLLGFAAWAYGAAHGRHGAGARFGRVAALAAVVGALAALRPLADSAPATRAETAESGVEPFSTERLAELRAEGRPVFVNMTAAWCVTCKINESVAITTPAVRAAFDAGNVAYLKGDWTRQDPEITAFLRAHGREGVPLYVYFPPDHGAPTVLPQILTQGTLLDEISARRG
jgi:thiol:disulfide interchange protein DsbD